MNKLLDFRNALAMAKGFESRRPPGPESPLPPRGTLQYPFDPTADPETRFLDSAPQEFQYPGDAVGRVVTPGQEDQTRIRRSGFEFQAIAQPFVTHLFEQGFEPGPLMDELVDEYISHMLSKRRGQM